MGVVVIYLFPRATALGFWRKAALLSQFSQVHDAKRQNGGQEYDIFFILIIWISKVSP